MTPDFLLQAIEPDRCRWRTSDGVAGAGDLAAAAAAARNSDGNVTVLLPTEAFLIAPLALPTRNPAKLRQAAPFAFEEHLLTDVGDVVVAVGEPTGDGSTACAAIGREEWLDWVKAWREAGLDVSHALPDALILPWRDGEWTRLVDGDRVLLRWGPAAAAAVPVDQEAAFKRSVVAAIGQPLTDRTVAGSVLDAAAASAADAPLNLMQGEWTPATRRGGWRIYRTAAVLATATLLLAVAVHWGRAFQLEARSDLLAERIRTEFAALAPPGQRIQDDPAPQIELALRQASGAQTGSGVLKLLRQAAPLLAGSPGVQLERLSFAEGRLRLELAAARVEQLDGLRLRLQSAGLDAELGGTRVDDQRVTGSITVGDRA